MRAKQLLALLLLLLVLTPYVPDCFAGTVSSPPVMQDSYFEPSFTVLSDGSYEYTTSFGIYTITYLAALKLYSVAFRNGDTIVTASALVVLENSLGSWLPLNVQPNPNRFSIGSPTFITAPTWERFAVTQTLDYKEKNVKETLGELTFIVAFSKSAFPKISVALTLDRYQVDPTCVNTLPNECTRETYWSRVGLKNMQWIWVVAPASGYDKYQSSTLGGVTILSSSSTISDAKAVCANFKGIKDWYADWSSVGSSSVSVEPASVNILGHAALVVNFDTDMTMIDPTFGLTSTGSTSYPTAKSVTATNQAQIDTAQSVFGGASGLFDGTGDSLTTGDSADWNFGTSAFTFDFRVRFNSLPSSTGTQWFYTQFQDTNNRWGIWVGNSSGTYYFGIIVKTASTTVVYITKNSNPNLAVNTWYHVAYVRSGNTWYIFQGGSSLGSSTDSDGFSDISSSLFVGTYDGTQAYLNGWFDEGRISNVARWTAAFTPNAARYDRDVNTLFLLHNDGADTSTTFLDDATTGLAKATWFRLTDNNAALSSVSFYTHTAGNYRVSIWNDTGATAPDNLLWESGDTAASVTTWNNVTISSGSPSSLTLQSGIVWLAWQWNPGAAYTAGPSYTAGSANNGTYLYQAYGAFPASWSGTASAEKWSIFATYSTNQNLVASLSDSGDGSDSVTRLLVQTRDSSSSGSGGESLSLQKAIGRSLSDAGNGLVSLIELFAGYPVNSDSGSGQESLERLLTQQRTFSSSGSGLEFLSTLKAIQRSLTDLGSGLDALVALLASVRGISETASGLESLSASKVLQRMLSDTGSGLDSLIRQAIFGRTVNESGSGTENTSAQTGLSRTLSEVGSGIDSLVRTLTFQRTNSEQGSGQDTLTRLFGINRDLSDAGVGIDSLFRQAVFGRMSTDSGSGNEDADGQAVLSRGLSEIGTGIEGVIRALSFGRTNSEQGSGQDILARLFVASRSTSDSGSGLDSLNTVLGRIVNLLDLGSGLDSLVRTLTFQRANLDQASGQDTLTRLFGVSRNISDAGAGLDSLIRQVLFRRTAADSGSGSEDPEGQIGLSRMLSEIGAGLENLIHATTFGRIGSEQGSGQDVLVKIFAANRNASDAGSGSESLAQILGHNLSLLIQGTGAETLSRLFTVNRTASETGIGDELLSRLLAVSRSIFDFGSALETLAHLLTPYAPPGPTGGGGAGVITPRPTTIMVGAVFPQAIWFLLPGARVSQDMTVSNPTDTTRTVTVDYTIVNVATGATVYEDTLSLEVPKGASTYTIKVVITEFGRYKINIIAVDGGTATATQEFDVTLWQVWQGPILLWGIIIAIAVALIIIYRRTQEGY